MLNFFKRKKDQKESNIASTPNQQTESANKVTKQGVIFFIWNILSITLYSSYTLFVIYNLTKKNFLSKIIIYLLVAYGVVFVLLILISLRNRTKMKYRLKNFQSATKFLKYLIQIINFTLSIITAISAFVTTGTTDISAILFGILSLFITFIFIFVEIAKIIIRKNMPLIKRNFLEIRDKREPKKNEDKNKNDQISDSENNN
jgi:hypothetical protein